MKRFKEQFRTLLPGILTTKQTKYAKYTKGNPELPERSMVLPFIGVLNGECRVTNLDWRHRVADLWLGTVGGLKVKRRERRAPAF
jgi:hypothetical protein